MKDGFTYIAVVLDRSGSMSSIRESTIGGFNKFLAEQKAVPGEALLTLAQFDDQYEIVHNALMLRDVPELTAATFVPRGYTALDDAIGRTIDALGARLAGMREQDRPSKVIVVIITDGGENASKEYKGRAAQMIEHQRTKYSWEFVYIGANQDAVATARSYNINPNNALNYAANNAGTQQAFTSASVGMRSYRLQEHAQVKSFFGPDDSGNAGSENTGGT